MLPEGPVEITVEWKDCTDGTRTCVCQSSSRLSLSSIHQASETPSSRMSLPAAPNEGRVNRHLPIRCFALCPVRTPPVLACAPLSLLGMVCSNHEGKRSAWPASTSTALGSKNSGCTTRGLMSGPEPHVSAWKIDRTRTHTHTRTHAGTHARNHSLWLSHGRTPRGS